MPEVAYLSATGELKIPLKVRTKLGLRPGQKFDVQVRGRNVRLIQLGLPAVEQVREFVAWAQEHPMEGTKRIPRGHSRGSRPAKRASPKKRRRPATA